MTEENARTDISQTRGDLFRFTGRKIAETQFETRGRSPAEMILDLWETEGGAYVAVSDARPIGGGFEDVRATVVEIGEPDPARPWVILAPTEEARQWHVMEAFGWDQRAMKMVRKALGWSFVREIG